MILLDKLSQRKTSPMIRAGGTQQTSPLPSVTDTINRPSARPLTTAPMSQKIEQLPERGAMGSMPQFAHIQKRFLADLPANMQLEGIRLILSGQETQNQNVNNFVKSLAAQGKSPEEIRQAFIAQQKTSADPLVIM